MEIQTSPLPEIVIGEVVVYAHNKFAADEEFHRALVDEALAAMVADEIDAIIRSRRNTASTGGYMHTAAGGVSRETIDRRAKEVAARIFIATKPGVRKSFMALVRPELKTDLARRRDQLAGELRWIALEEDLAKGMKDDTTTLGDVYSDTAFERIWRKHFEPKSND